MIIDTSVLIAILLGEPEAERLVGILSSDKNRLLSAVSLVEAGIVILNRKGQTGIEELDKLVSEAMLTVIPVDLNQAALAREAYRQYGKGRHPAKLNFGDCFSYALAKSRQESLLFKGDDFNKTDIACCIDWKAK